MVAQTLPKKRIPASGEQHRQPDKQNDQSDRGSDAAMIQQQRVNDKEYRRPYQRTNEGGRCHHLG